MSTNTESKLVKPYSNITVETLPESEVAITGTITVEALEAHKAEALEHFKKEIDLPGFRKGHVPEKIILERVGEMGLLEEAGERALQSYFAEILAESKMDIIGQPSVSISKLAIGQPMEFKITAAILPVFTPADYKSIAKEHNKKREEIKVEEKEVEEAILGIRKMKADIPHDQKDVDITTLPELNDDLVKTFGNFENVEDFTKKVRESIENEKKHRATEKHRLSIIEEILEKTDITLPKIIIEAELDRMMGRMQEDITRMGHKFNEYLEKIGKSEADLRADWRNDANARAKMEIIIERIATDEKIEAPQDEVEKEVKHLLEHYTDADPLRAGNYFSEVIRREKVFQFLEAQ